VLIARKERRSFYSLLCWLQRTGFFSPLPKAALEWKIIKDLDVKAAPAGGRLFRDGKRCSS